MAQTDNQLIKRLIKSPKRVFAIHYACENLSVKTQGNSSRIASISLVNMFDGQTETFSLPIEAERKSLRFQEIPEHLEELERNLLHSFFMFLADHPDSYFVHWNMSDAVYGFPALYHRYEVLFGRGPSKIPNEAQFDLSQQMKARFGQDYIDYPRLQNLLEFNKFSSPSLLGGEDEAARLSRGEYDAVSRSNIAKTKGILYLFGLFAENKIKVPNTGSWFSKLLGK